MLLQSYNLDYMYLSTTVTGRFGEVDLRGPYLGEIHRGQEPCHSSDNTGVPLVSLCVVPALLDVTEITASLRSCFGLGGGSRIGPYECTIYPSHSLI